MKSNFRTYDYIDGANRIKEILNASEVSYEERDALPSRDALTFDNGYYAYCSALFIDIRDSSKLPRLHERPTLAKLYRAYVSEMVAVLNASPQCVEVNIVGDGVWAIYNTPAKTDIDEVYRRAYTAASMLRILNAELEARRITAIKVGIGMSYGRALMVKAGLEGAAINDVVYMGDVVNEAAHLAAKGNKMFAPQMMVSDVFKNNLNELNQGLLSWSNERGCWSGTVIDTAIERWTDDNY